MKDHEKMMVPSLFRLSDEALLIARELLVTDGRESPDTYRNLHAQFMQNIPADKECFLSTDYFPAMDMWETLRKKGCLGVFDPGDELIAVISKDDVLHKEDFADMMKASGMETTEGNFNKVWSNFIDKILSGVPLRDGAFIAVEVGKRVIEKTCPLSELIQKASAQKEKQEPAVMPQQERPQER